MTHPFANLMIFLCLWFPEAIPRHCCCCCPCPRTSHGPCPCPCPGPPLPPIAAPSPRPADEAHPGLVTEDQSDCGLILASMGDHDIVQHLSSSAPSQQLWFARKKKQTKKHKWMRQSGVPTIVPVSRPPSHGPLERNSLFISIQRQPLARTTAIQKVAVAFQILWWAGPLI